MSLNVIKTFSDDIKTLDQSMVGAKAFALAGLYQKDFPVPNGFIVTTGAFDAILSQIRAKGDYFGAGAAEIRQKIIESEMPPELAEAINNAFVSLNAASVAVRSSATIEDGRRLSYAGQFSSFLGTEKKDLLSKVKLVWASLFGQAAGVYPGKGRDSGKMAVLVQEMVMADMAGVCFSVDPVSRDTNSIIIESVRGLGESLAQGAVVPDRYFVSKDTLIVKEKNVNMNKITDDGTIEQIARFAARIEKLYGSPVDIEWAAKDGRPYILQARPITTLQ